MKDVFPEPRNPITRILNGVGSRLRRRILGDNEAAVDWIEWRLLREEEGCEMSGRGGMVEPSCLFMPLEDDLPFMSDRTFSGVVACGRSSGDAGGER